MEFRLDELKTMLIQYLEKNTRQKKLSPPPPPGCRSVVVNMRHKEEVTSAKRAGDPGQYGTVGNPSYYQTLKSTEGCDASGELFSFPPAVFILLFCFCCLSELSFSQRPKSDRKWSESSNWCCLPLKNTTEPMWQPVTCIHTDVHIYDTVALGTRLDAAEVHSLFECCKTAAVLSGALNHMTQPRCCANLCGGFERLKHTK